MTRRELAIEWLRNAADFIEANPDMRVTEVRADGFHDGISLTVEVADRVIEQTDTSITVKRLQLTPLTAEQARGLRS